MTTPSDSRIAVLVDCDNVPSEIVEHALRCVAQFGRVVIRRGYGCQETLAQKWRDTLVALSFSPYLQYRYAAGKNISDIALALDALEMLMDGRADTFCVVTSDSDFSYLCRKLRERGGTVCIVGEPKTPPALRNASDHFFEWTQQQTESVTSEGISQNGVSGGLPQKAMATKVVKRRPRFIIDAVTMLAGDTPEGKVDMSALGQYLKRTDPGFSPKTYGHSGLLDMVKTYDLLETKMGQGGHWTVNLAKATTLSAEA